MAESGPVNADKQQQLQARAPEAAGSDSEFLPPGAMGILDLQRKAGNRAVTAAIASGSLWSAPGGRPMPMLQLMPAVQRWAGNRAATTLRARTIQREPPSAAPAKPENTDRLASMILHRIRKAVRVAHGAMQHVPPARADELIGLVAAYAKAYPDFIHLQRILLGEHEDMHELLAPWGYVGRAIKLGGDGKLTDDQPVESLLQSLAAWKADDARARKKRRANTRGSFGYYDREITTAEMARDDAQVEAGPSRDTPADPWEDTHEGTRGNRRLERQDIRNQRALDKMAGIKNQGPGGFLGMVIGGVVGAVHPGMNAQQGAEAGMEAGALLDGIIMVHAAAPGGGGTGGQGQGSTEASHTRKAPERAPMPTPNRPGGGGRGGGGGGGGSGGGRPGDTLHGVGAVGPAGQGAKPTTMGMGAAGPAGLGARPTAGVGHLEVATPGQVISAFKRNPNYVRHSTSDKWHAHIWRDELIKSGKWNPHDGPAPEAPMAFHLKNGMLQVNNIAWLDTRGSLNEILRPHERVGSGPAGSGGPSGGGGSGGGGGRGGGGRGGKAGTEAGYAQGPGADPGPARSGKTQVGVPAGPGGVKPTWKVPDGPPPVPPGNTVRPASQAEVKALFEKDPYSVIVSDGLEMHQYIWEYKNWRDGKRVTTDAPAAFWMPHGQVRVHSELWQKAGGNVFEILAPQSSGRQANEFEAANTLPGGAGGGAGSTNVSIAPGLDKKK